LLQSCPAFKLLDWPVKCPLYARAIDIFGLRPKAQQFLCFAVFLVQQFGCCKSFSNRMNPLAGSPG